MIRPEQTPSLNHKLNPFLRHELFPQPYNNLVNEASAEQGKVGWFHMLRGFLSVKWHQIASSHFTGSPDGQDSIGNRNDGAHRMHRANKNYA
jgi:hypothetical protein